mgnify:CR=1 FL=1
MSVCGDAFWSELEGARNCGHVDVRQTHWAMIIKDAEAGTNCDHIPEGVLKILDVVAWDYAIGPLGNAAFMTQLSLSAAFVVTGFGIYTHAGRGFRQEVHLDGLQSEVRFATRNSRICHTQFAEYLKGSPQGPDDARAKLFSEANQGQESISRIAPAPQIKWSDLADSQRGRAQSCTRSRADGRSDKSHRA